MLVESTSAPSIASLFLTAAQFDEVELTQMQLQKLVFFAQSLEIHDHGVPAFQEPVQAWKHGPAVKSVYRMYKVFGNSPISAIDRGPQSTQPVSDKLLLSVDRVWRLFGSMSGSELRTLTHDSGPWPAHFRADVMDIELPPEEIGAAWDVFSAKASRRSEARRNSARRAELAHAPIGSGQFGHAEYEVAKHRFHAGRPSKSGG